MKVLSWVVVVILGAAIVAELVLLLGGYRLLVREDLVKPGQTYVLDGWGNLGTAQQAQLVCFYFTGRSILPTVFWYSQNGIMGQDECPFIVAA